jgi:uncharacterized protein
MPPWDYSLFLLLSTLPELIVASLMLFALRLPDKLGGRRVTIARVVLTTIAAGLVFAFKAGVLFVVKAVWLWGVIGLVYVQFVIAIPLMAAVVLVVSMRSCERRASWPVVGLNAGAVLIAPLVGMYASLYEPFNLRLETATLDVAGFEPDRPLRIAVLSDLQCWRITDHERAAARAAIRAEPDLILIPGDLYAKPRTFVRTSEALFDEHLPDFQSYFAALEAPLGVFATPGNVDADDRIHRLLDDTGVVYLNRDLRVVTFQGQRIAIVGMGRYQLTREIAAIEEQIPDDIDLVVSMAHYPDAANQAPHDARTDLFVSGHTHGGQVRLPGVGPLLNVSMVPRRVAGGGLHTLRSSGHTVYVSRGVGMERAGAPPLRFLCPPEVSLIEVE